MESYIIGTQYSVACKAIELIKQWAVENELSDVVDANITVGGVAVQTETQLQVYQLNVVLSEISCFITSEKPFPQKTDDEKKSILNQYGIK